MNAELELIKTAYRNNPDRHNASLMAQYGLLAPEDANHFDIELKARPKKQRKNQDDSELESEFSTSWHLLGYPEFDRHFQVSGNGRTYEIDFYNPNARVGVNINGGIWMERSGHSWGPGLIRDYELLMVCHEQGITLLMIAPDWLKKSTIAPLCARIYTLIKDKAK